ncbi:MAG: HPr family phosphocarrier protein [Treponema sp.]|nr:HPr family phosphocarrier protein [Treponema sp.]
MTEQIVTISNRAGVHARPAAMVVQTTKNFKCNIYFERGDKHINAKSIMGVITLGATFGTHIKITAEGEDEQDAVKALVRLFESKFEEE